MTKGSDLLFYTVVAGTILVFGWVKLGPFIRRKLSRVENEKEPIGDLFRWAFSSTEFYRRLLATIGILLLTTVAGWCPLPGFNHSLLSRYGIGLNSAFFSIVALGLGPYFSGCILVQFACLLVKPWRPHLFNGGRHRVTLVRATVIVTLVITLLQAVGIMVGLTQQGFISPAWHFKIITVATLVAGTIFLLVMAYGISRYGIGHGFGLIFLVSFLGNITDLLGHGAGGVGLVGFVVALIGMAGLSWWVTNLRLDIPIVANNSGGGFKLSIRPTWVGTEPHSWVLFFLFLPATVSQFVGSPKLTEFLGSLWSQGVITQIIHAILIAPVCFVYISLLFRPTHLLQRLQTHGFSLAATDPDLKTLLDKKRRNITVISVVILLSFGFLSNGLREILGWPHAMSLLGMPGILVAVGVFSDCIARLRFLRERQSIGNCVLVYTATDEIEATIKKEFLRVNDITALIEPLRFTWGMPIRTMVDEYRIHVRNEELKKATALLG